MCVTKKDIFDIYVVTNFDSSEALEVCGIAVIFQIIEPQLTAGVFPPAKHGSRPDQNII